MKIALVGNQNSGKTTLFNALTGLTQKVGNWPGVTVEKRIGMIKKTQSELIDLPGIYSFNPYTTEEKIAKEYILTGNVDVIINVVDATNLERNLYLTTQLLELTIPVVIALNRSDVAQKKGIVIDEERLEKELGVKVYKISAKTGKGVEKLITSIQVAHKRKNPLFFQKGMEEYEIMAMKRYEYLDDLIEKVVSYRKRRISLTDSIDKLILNQYLAFPFFLVVVILMYYFSISVIGNKGVAVVTSFIENLKAVLEVFLFKMNVSNMLSSFILDGMVSGVSTILTFLPQLVILFFCISVLETSGYLSRIAFIFDSFFRRIGLSGKSIISFIVGSSCSVPGMMATRMIEKDGERLKTVALTPFIPCNAKLPIIALFSSFFFQEHAALAVLIFYFLGILLIIGSAFLWKKNSDDEISYVAELPEYQVPSMGYVLKDVWMKTLSFVKRVGSTILLCSMILWLLLSFSPKLKYGVPIEKSIIATIGKNISWIFKPMLGVDSWEATVSIMQGIVAKEQVVSSMSVISGVANGANSKVEMFRNGEIFGFFTLSSACAFITFNLFTVPCINAIIAMKKELGSFGKWITVMLFQILIAYGVSVFIYQVGSKFLKC